MINSSRHYPLSLRKNPSYRDFFNLIQMKLFEALNLIIGTFGCSYYDYYELDIDARDQSGADRGRGYKLFFPESGGIKFG